MTDPHPDLGPPISYLVATAGLPVHASDGSRVGWLAHVLASESQDIFEGLVITLDDDDPRYADRDDVAEIHERGVLLTLDREGVRALHRPSENPVAVAFDPSEPPDHGLQTRLRRAWDLLSGNY